MNGVVATVDGVGSAVVAVTPAQGSFTPQEVADNFVVVRALPEPVPVLIASGIPGLRGAPGLPGPPGGGSGVTYVQDFAPPNPLDQQTWYNPLTLQLKVYTSAAWRPVSPDGGHF
jgi:hypothetical protein